MLQFFLSRARRPGDPAPDPVAQGGERHSVYVVPGPFTSLLDAIDAAERLGPHETWIYIQREIQP